MNLTPKTRRIITIAARLIVGVFILVWVVAPAVILLVRGGNRPILFMFVLTILSVGWLINEEQRNSREKNQPRK